MKENYWLRPACQYPTTEMIFAALLFSLIIPLLMFYEVFSGRRWACYLYALYILFNYSYPLLLDKNFSDLTNIHSHDLEIRCNFYDWLMLLSSLLLFTPKSNKWFLICNSISKKSNEKNFIFVLILIISSFFVLLLVLFVTLNFIVDAGFASLSNGDPNSCRVVPEIVLLLTLFEGVPFQIGIPGAVLLYCIANSHNWARIAYLLFSIAIAILITAYFPNWAYEEDWDFPQTTEMIFLTLSLNGILFYLPASNRWFKRTA